MLESKFQANLIKQIKQVLPEATILKNDPNYIQAIPDLLVILERRCLAIECKRSKTAPFRPNQEYYLKKFDGVVAYPGNEREIIDEVIEVFYR